MKRALVLTALGVAMFIGFAAATLPAQAVFDLAAGPHGVRAGLVQGSVWDAAAFRVRSGEVRLAEVRARLQSSSLLSGAARFDVQVIDPAARGQGQVVLSTAGLFIENAQGVIALDSFAMASALPPGQSAQVRISRIALDAQGRCQSADAHVTTAALMAAGEALGAALPLLEGEFFCAGDQLALALSGENDRLSLDGRILFEPGEPSWSVQARTTDRDVAAALSLAGFQQEGPGVFALDSARLNAGG